MSFPRIPDGLSYTDKCVDPSGWGIIATRDWQQGEFIGDFEGEVMLKTDFTKIYGKDYRYVYYTRHNFPNSRVIVAKDPRNFIGYINENRSAPNVLLRQKKLWCKTPIRSGEELFLKYDTRDYPKY